MADLTITEYFDIIQNVSITIASIAAIWGIDSWRREAQWKRKYELTEEALCLFYQAEESFRKIRNPFANINEGSTRIKNTNESAKDTELLNRAYIIHERYEREKDIFIQLRKIKHRFKAVFEKDSIEPFQEIEDVLNNIFFASHLLGKIYWPNQGMPMSESEFQTHLKKMHEYQSIYWEGIVTPDPINNKVKDIIKKIEDICKRKNKQKGLSSFWRGLCIWGGR